MISENLTNQIGQFICIAICIITTYACNSKKITIQPFPEKIDIGEISQSVEFRIPFKISSLNPNLELTICNIEKECECYSLNEVKIENGNGYISGTFNCFKTGYFNYYVTYIFCESETKYFSIIQGNCLNKFN